MKKIANNIIGLFRFIALIFLVFAIPRRVKKRDEEQSKRDMVAEFPSLESLLSSDTVDKYRSILGHASDPLVPTEAVFCSKCHVLVAQIRRTKRGIDVIQHGRVLVTVGGNVTIRDGKEIKGFPIKCPHGHTTRIE